jgi:AcrR family transcriptional regulator
MVGKGRAPSSRTAPDRLAASSNGFGYEHVGEIQRSRMLAAMTEVVCERGAANVTVAHVVARSGVSRRTFYEQFTDREECFLAAFDEAVARARGYVIPQFQAAGRWRDRIRGSLAALLQLFDDEPFMRRLLVVESLGGGRRSLERRSCVLAQLVAVVDGGRAETKGGSRTTRLTAEGVVGAVVSVLHSRLLESDPGRLAGLVNPLMSMIVLPYLGPAAARRELEEPVLAVTMRGPAVHGNPLKGLDMRLTYRTVRALAAVAANRGSSNRMVGEASGINDQGQVSKLLARLERLGLVENTGGGFVRGEPNAWVLTERGEEVHGAIAGQTQGA